MPKLSVAAVALFAACHPEAAGPVASSVTNPKVPFSNFGTLDGQLIFESDEGVKVADFHTHSISTIGPGYQLGDITDDGSMVILTNSSALVILRGGTESGRVQMPHFRWSAMSVSPDHKYLAAAAHGQLFVVDLESRAITTIPTESVEGLTSKVKWTANDGIVLITADAANNNADIIDPHVYNVTTGAMTASKVAASDLNYSRFAAAALETESPTTCTKADGTVVPGDWKRLIKGVYDDAESHAITAWMFLPDCSVVANYDEALWLVDNAGNANNIGKLPAGSHQVMFYPGTPFGAK